MNRRRLFIPVIAGGGGGYDWYVDGDIASSGNGKTLAGAFKTIAEAQAVMTAGQSVWIEPLSSGGYKEQLTLPGNNCSVFSSGVVTNGSITTQGAIIDCSTAYANASFSKTGGQTNIYQVAITTNYTASEPAFVGVWEDNVRLTFQTSLANCDANAGSYYVADHNATSITVYIHASDSSDITANGKVYEISNRNSGVYGFGYTGITISGIECRRNYALGGSIKVSNSATVKNCVVRDGCSHNIYTGEGSTLTDVLATGAYYTVAFSMYIHNTDVGAGNGMTYTRCYAELAAPNALATGFYGHVNTSGGFGTVTYTDCNITNCSNGYSFANATTVTVSGGTLTDVVTGLNITNTGITTINATGVTFTTTASARFAFVGTSITPPALNFSGLTVSHGQSLSNTASIYLGSTTTLSVTNSTFTNSYTVAAGCVFIWANGAGITMTLTSTGNTFHTPNLASGPYCYYAANNAGAGITSDFNTFSREASWFHNGTSYSTLTTWKAASGQDANSTIG